MRIFLGFLGIVAGFMFVWKSNWITNNFGRLEWAEQRFALSGGTRTFWKLFGMAVIIGSFLLMFNFLGGIVIGVLGDSFSSLK